MTKREKQAWRARVRWRLCDSLPDLVWSAIPALPTDARDDERFARRLIRDFKRAIRSVK